MSEPIFAKNQDITNDNATEYAQASMMDTPYITVDAKDTGLIGGNSMLAGSVSMISW